MADKRLAYTAAQIDDALGKSLQTRSEIEGLTKGEVPLKGDSGLGVSSITQDADGKVRISKQILAEGGVDSVPGTYSLGDGLDIKASGPQLINQSRVTGKRYQVPYQEIDKTGTKDTFVIEAGAEHQIVPQSVYDTELTSPADATLTAAQDEIVNAIYIRISDTIGNFRYQTVSVSTGEVIDSFPDKFAFEKGQGITISGAGEHKIDLYYSGESTPARFLAGQQVRTTMYWSGGTGTVLGNSSNVPYYALDVQDMTKQRVITVPDMDNYIKDVQKVGNNLVFTRGNDNTTTIALDTSYLAPQVTNFSINIASQILKDTNINNPVNISFDLANHVNVATLVVTPSEGTASTFTKPSSDGSHGAVVTLSGIDTSTAKDITFRLTGTDTQGGTFGSNTVTVKIVDSITQKYVFHGATSDAVGAVNLDSLTKVEYTNPGQEVAYIDTASVGDYFYVFVPDDPDLNKIYNTTFGDTDITSQFTKTASAKTYNGISYTAYQLGPSQSAGEMDLKVVMN